MSLTESKLSSKARDFLSESPLKSFIGGEWVASANGQTMKVLDPGTGEPITEFYVMQPSDVDRAVRDADESFRSSGWATMSPEDRGGYLYRLAELIERDADTLCDIETLDVGFTRTTATLFIWGGAALFRYYADIAKNINYDTPLSLAGHEGREILKPYGVCAVINPWNAPFYSTILSFAPALAAGNTIVLKPASFTPLSTIYLARLVAEAGIPAGVINVLAVPQLRPARPWLIIQELNASP